MHDLEKERVNTLDMEGCTRSCVSKNAWVHDLEMKECRSSNLRGITHASLCNETSNEEGSRAMALKASK